VGLLKTFRYSLIFVKISTKKTIYIAKKNVSTFNASLAVFVVEWEMFERRICREN